MGKTSRMFVGASLLAVLSAGPTVATAGPVDAPHSSPAGTEPAVPTDRVKRIGTRLETIVVAAGAVDRDGRRWNDSGAGIGVLPTLPDSAFLDGDGGTDVASPAALQP